MGLNCFTHSQTLILFCQWVVSIYHFAVNAGDFCEHLIDLSLLSHYSWNDNPLPSKSLCVCFITAGPITKLCAWGEEESGGHVL